nr:MAG TPA: hypothetical protein [Bacteriophage sp.]
MVICEQKEALCCAVQFYFRQRRFGRVYTFPVSACRKPFVLIVSECERKKLGLSVKRAVSVLGDEPDDAETWTLAKKHARLEMAYREAMRRLRYEKDV